MPELIDENIEEKNDYDFRTYELKITTLSPVHIGSGNTLEEFSCVIKDNIMYLFNWENLYNIMDEPKKRYIIDKTPEEIKKHIDKTFFENKEKIQFESIPVTSSVSKTLNNRFPDISSFMRCNKIGNPYIPGSSIKGAIRTAVLDCLAHYDEDVSNRIQNSPAKDDKDYHKFIEGKLLNCTTEVTDHKKEKKEIFVIENDPFKGLKISDCFSEYQNQQIEIGLTRAIRTEKRTDLFCEVIKENSVFKCCLNILDEFIINDRVYELEKIAAFCKYFYKKTLKSDIDELFKKFNNNDLKQNMENILNKIKKIKNANCFPLRLGRGCGKHFLTYEKVNSRFPKTRRIYEHKYPMGWVIVEFKMINSTS